MIDVPDRTRSCSASSAARDWVELDRSMKTGSRSRVASSIRGSRRASALATPAMSRRSSAPMITGSRLLWWLPMKIAGRSSQVLGAGDLEPDAGDGQGGIARRRDAEVDPRPLVPADRTDHRAAQEPGVEAGDRSCGGDGRAQSCPERLLHVQDRPALQVGRLPQRPARADRVRPSGAGQERDVLVAVGVAIALGQVDAALAGEVPDGAGLVLAPQEGTDHPAGQHAVLGLQLGADDVVDAEAARDGSGLEAGGRRGEDDGVSHPLVGLDDGARLGTDGAGDLLHEEPLAELLELLHGVARAGR